MRAFAVVLIALGLVGSAAASAPPVGPLPTPTRSTVKTVKGSLFAVALPRRAGYDWRIARGIDARVVREISEGDVGPSVVVVFRAVGKGHATIVFAETRGETAKAYRAARYDVTVV